MENSLRIALFDFNFMQFSNTRDLQNFKKNQTSSSWVFSLLFIIKNTCLYLHVWDNKLFPFNDLGNGHRKFALFCLILNYFKNLYFWILSWNEGKYNWNKKHLMLSKSNDLFFSFLFWIQLLSHPLYRYDNNTKKALYLREIKNEILSSLCIHFFYAIGRFNCSRNYCKL